MALGPVGNRHGSVKCWDIEPGKNLHRRTVTQLPWSLDNKLLKKIEHWGKKGASVIKRGCVDFLNRSGEKIDWENDDMSELKVVSEQPKLVDPGVADIPSTAEPEEELGGPHEVKGKPSYVTRAVAARRRAGLDVESAPHQSRGVEVHADNVIVIDDEGDETQIDIPAPEAHP